MPFAVRRARHRAATLGALALVTAVAAASVAVIGALASRAYDDGIDGMLAQADPRDRAVVVTMPLSSDQARGDDEATALSQALSDALAGQPVDMVVARVATAALQTPSGDVPLELLADADAQARAELVSGAWPDASGEVALAEPAAVRLGAATGDVLALSGGDVRVVGVWRALDPAAPAWAGDPAVASGQTGDAIGPVLVRGDADLAGAPRLGVRVTIVAGELSVASATDLRRALDTVVGVVQSPVARTDAGPAAVDGGLASTLSQALSTVAGARVALIVPLAELAVVAAIIVGVLVFALGRARSDELALVIARGARRRGVWAGLVAELATASVVGAVAGALAALVVAPPLDSVLCGTVAAVAAAAVGAAVSGSAVARASGGPASRSRPAVVALLLVTLALAAAAALTVAQAIARGGIVQPGGAVDPLAVAAPWLVLAALGLGLSLLAGPAAGAGERLTRRSPGFAARFGVLQLARRPQSVLAGVLCLVLASAGLALAGTLAVGVARGDAASAAAVGAPLRARVDVPAALDDRNPALPVDELRRASAIGSAWPAVANSATIGGAPLQLLTTSPAGFAAMEAPDETDALLGALAAVDAPELTGESLTVEITAVIPGGGVAPTGEPGGTGDADAPPVPAVVVGAWALDDDGAPVHLDVGTAPADGAAHVLTVPRGAATRLISVDATGRNIPVQSISAAVAVSSAAGAITLDASTASISTSRSARFTAARDAATIPVVITSALANEVHAPVGGILHLEIRGATREVSVEVAGIVPALPGVGAGAGAALDAGSLTAALVVSRSAVLVPATLLIRPSDSGTGSAEPAADAAAMADATAAVRAWATHPIRITAAADAGAMPVSMPTLILTGVAALIGALLGVVGFVVVFAAVARDRRAEAVPLRSFGFGAGAQRRSRLVERLAAVLFALVAGALAGWLTAVVVGPLLLPALTGAAS